MNRMKQIKERAKITENLNDDRADINYLLYVIEQAEKAFEEINYQFELHEHEIVDNAIKNVDDIATKALQVIKGDE